MLIFSIYIITNIFIFYNINENKKRRNATKPRFSTIQSSIDVAGIRNER